jgi:hypothetical protein|tara:strand:- start:6178 stop:6573 length:396 start_codon:yes stop_codon:yes gene_type:complete
MALMRTHRVTEPFVPASYTSNETTAVLNVAAGDMITHVFMETATVFNGAGTDAIVTLGDGADPDRYVLAGNVDETTLGFYAGAGGSGSDYLLIGQHVYTSADTIDLVFTANTSGTRTTGKFNVIAHKTKVF